MKKLLGLVMLGVLLIGGLLGVTDVKGATANYGLEYNMELWHFQYAGPYTGTSTSNTPIKFVVPAKYTVIAVGCTGNTIDLGSGNETYYVDIKEGATSILSAPMNIVAQATAYPGVLSDTSLADESTISILPYGSGTTPSLADVSVWMYVIRSN